MRRGWPARKKALGGPALDEWADDAQLGVVCGDRLIDCGAPVSVNEFKGSRHIHSGFG
jgi:hypothetical protein